MKRVMVVDGNNILMRAVKVVQGRGVDLSTVDGVDTAALHIFIQSLAKHICNVDPTHFVLAWDGGRSTHRLSVYPEYKNARVVHERADDVGPFSQAKEFLSLSGLHHVEMTDVEADDIVAHYWSVHRPKNMNFLDEVVILSGDKDFLQLLGGGVTQIRPGVPVPGGRREDEQWNEESVYEKFGVTPEQLGLCKVLTGDPGDGVPPVPGFGMKTAIKVLAYYDWDLDKFMHDEKGPFAKKLGDNWRDIPRNHKLVYLRDGLPDLHLGVAPDFRPTEAGGVLYRSLVDFLQRYQLAKIESRLRAGTLWSEGVAVPLG